MAIPLSPSKPTTTVSMSLGRYTHTPARLPPRVQCPSFAHSSGVSAGRMRMGPSGGFSAGAGAPGSGHTGSRIAASLPLLRRLERLPGGDELAPLLLEDLVNLLPGRQQLPPPAAQ